MNPIQAMTTGDALSQLAARVRYGILSAAEALAKPGLSPSERKRLAALLAAEESEELPPAA